MYKNRSKNLQYAASKPKESEAEKEAKRYPRSKGMPAPIGGQCIHVGSIVTGTVKRIEKYGMFVSIDEARGFVHVSEIANEWISHPSEYFQIGDKIKAIVIELDIRKFQLRLSIKQLPDRRKLQSWANEYLEWYEETMRK